MIYSEEACRKLEKRLRQTELLVQAAHDFTSSLDIDEVMPQILDRALEVIDAADAGAIFLYDKESGLLRPVACAGYEWDPLSKIAMMPGESMTGQTFFEQVPKIFHSADIVKSTMRSMGPSNRKLYEEALRNLRKTMCDELVLKSAMCAPMHIKGEAIGVMVTDNFSTEVCFTEDDLNLLITVANQAAVALENARLYKEERSHRKELEALNEVIEQHNQKLFHINQAHHLLMQQVLAGGSIEGIIRTIEGILLNPVLIFDSLLEDLMDGVGAPPRHETDTLMQFLHKVTIDWKQCRVPRKAGLPFPVILMPIIAADRLLGVLVIIEENRPLDEQGIALAEQCSIVLALELLRRDAVFETENRLSGDFLDELISGKNIEKLKGRAQSLGLDTPDSYYTFMIMEIKSNEIRATESLQPIVYSRMQKAIERNLLRRSPHSIVVTRLSRLVVLNVAEHKQNPEADISHCRNLAQEMIITLKQLYAHVDANVGIGRISQTLEGLPQSYDDARQCMELLAKQKGKNKVIDYIDLGAARFVLNQSEEEVTDFVLRTLRPLLTYQNRKKMGLIKALDAFIQSGRNIKEAAYMLQIPANTLLYRLKRVEELMNISLDDSAHYFNLLFAWQVMDIYGIKRKVFMAST